MGGGHSPHTSYQSPDEAAIHGRGGSLDGAGGLARQTLALALGGPPPSPIFALAARMGFHVGRSVDTAQKET